jgi:light-independent protochlorophyllide reductase subunit B
MFKDDFEFHQEAAPSHLGSVMRQAMADPIEPAQETSTASAAATPAAASMSWTPDGEQELKKIPFFVRGKAKRNTERYALDHGIALITVETLYDAKAHFSH